MPGCVPVMDQLAHCSVLSHLVVRRGFARLPDVIDIVDREATGVVVNNHLIDVVTVAALGEMAGEKTFNIRP